MPIRTIALPIGAWTQPPSRVGPPAYDTADLNVVQGINFDGGRANFDDAQAEFLMLSLTVPDNHLSTGSKDLVISWISNTATTGDVRWAAVSRSIPDSGTWDAGFGAFQVDDDTVDATLGDIKRASIALSSTWVPGEIVQIVLQRAGDNFNDNMIGDAVVVMIHLLIEVEEQDVLIVASTEAQDGAAGTLSVGQFAFDASEWAAGSVFTFGGVINVTDGAETGTMDLYNLTDAESVTGASRTTSSTTFVKVESAALTVGAAAGNLQDTEKIYEIRISITGGSGTDDINLGTAFLRIT